MLASSPHARAAADDQPWVLDANNWQEGKDLLPEPVAEARQGRAVLVQGRSGRSRRSSSENYSKKFWDATEANEGKYDLEPKTCGLKDKATGKIPEFVFGYPFPKIDKSDPQAACKIAWNFSVRRRAWAAAAARRSR